MGVARPGVVYLVGAGPGDPGLMTVRSLELIATADSILHDRLIPDAALAGAREDAELRYVGKEPGAGSVPQDRIHEELVERARRGLSVVRLKGGDPFVFGRGGEEAEALHAAGVRFEVVPGVTAGVAAPAYAGIPVTHRDDASAVAFVRAMRTRRRTRPRSTGQPSPGSGNAGDVHGREEGWRTSQRASWKGGRDPGEPAAAVERGTLPGQRQVLATLSTLADAVSEAGLRPPAVLISAPSRPAARPSGGSSAPAPRQARRRHPRPGSGERAGRNARGAGGRGRSASGDQDRAPNRDRRRSRRRRGPPHLRVGVPDQPQRRATPVRGNGGERPRCASARPGAGRGDRPGDGGGASRAGRDRGRGPRALGRRGARRGPRGRADQWQARPRRAGGGGPGRPARRAPRARRRGRRRCALRDGPRGAGARSGRGGDGG